MAKRSVEYVIEFQYFKFIVLKAMGTVPITSIFYPSRLRKSYHLNLEKSVQHPCKTSQVYNTQYYLKNDNLLNSPFYQSTLYTEIYKEICPDRTYRAHLHYVRTTNH